MSEEPAMQTPNVTAKNWLYAFERCARDRAYEEAEKLFHKNCVYYGLVADNRQADWLAWWTGQLQFTVDISTTKTIPEGNLTLAATSWLARPIVHGAPQKSGKLVVALMRFTNDKNLAVLLHVSRCGITIT